MEINNYLWLLTVPDLAATEPDWLELQQCLTPSSQLLLVSFHWPTPPETNTQQETNQDTALLYNTNTQQENNQDTALLDNTNTQQEREREMFYLTMHSTHFIYGYMASDIWLRTILIVRKETRCRHIGYSYRLTARVLLYAPSHRQDNTYHGLCYTSRGALAGTRNHTTREQSRHCLSTIRKRMCDTYINQCNNNK